MKKPIKKHIKKTTRMISDKLGLILEGHVILAEFDDQGKITSKVELDSKSILQSIAYVLSKSSPKKKKP
ncbi:MAG: hypothetical protein WC523_04570 [Patescibacteria group bacterium]